MARTKREAAIHDTLDRLIETLKREGADQVCVSFSTQRAESLEIRDGEIEELSTSETMRIGMRVWVGQKSQGTSLETNNPDDLRQAARDVIQSARAKPDDPYTLPAEPSQFSKIRTNARLDVYDSTRPDSVHMLKQVQEMELAALAVDGVAKSEGASAQHSESMSVLKTTFGFETSTRSTNNSLGIQVIAQKEGNMQTGGEFSRAIYGSDLEDPALLGQRAGREAVAALNPQKVPVTGKRLPIIFHPDIGVSLLGHFTEAVNGENIRKGGTFFSRDTMGQHVMPAAINILNNPHIKRGLGSRMVTGDGLPTREFWLVKNGILENLLLDLENARYLGLDKTAIINEETNLTIEPGIITPETMIAGVTEGFYVTGLMGQGVDITSGNYSRGASGFWIKNGEIAYPIDEATIAGNLRDMFTNLAAANDLRRMRGAIAVPTLRVDGMVIA
jgi:PmbA protein